MNNLKEILIKNKEKLAILGQFLLVGAVFFGLGVLYEESKITKKNQLIEVVQKEHIQANISNLDLEIKSPSKAPAETSGGSTSRNNQAGGKVSEISKDMLYVASKNGKAYYKITCSNRIKEENKIYFKTEEDAQKSGFSPAKSCFK